MDLMECLLTRRSVRTFTEEPVGETELTAIMRAGMFAPSAKNIRSWEFLTVTDRQKLDALSGFSRYWGMLREAPLCIVCGGRYPAGYMSEDEFLVQNTIAAVENMLLCAHGLGLGAVWLGIAQSRPYHEPVKELLGIPPDVRLSALIAAGHIRQPLAPRPAPHDRFEPEKWHKERW